MTQVKSPYRVLTLFDGAGILFPQAAIISSTSLQFNNVMLIQFALTFMRSWFVIWLYHRINMYIYIWYIFIYLYTPTFTWDDHYRLEFSPLHPTRDGPRIHDLAIIGGPGGDKPPSRDPSPQWTVKEIWDENHWGASILFSKKLKPQKYTEITKRIHG